MSGTTEAFARVKRVKIDTLLQDADWNLINGSSDLFEHALPDGTNANYVLWVRQGRALLPADLPPFLKPAAPLPPATCAVKQGPIRTGQSPYPPTNHPGGGAALPTRNRMNQQNSANPRR